MFTSHFQLVEPGAEEKFRSALTTGQDVPALGLRFRYDGEEVLAVTVPSSVPPPQVSSSASLRLLKPRLGDGRQFGKRSDHRIGPLLRVRLRRLWRSLPHRT
jgi:hypothetical protein